MKSPSLYSIMICLALPAIAGNQSTAQILAFVPMTDTITVLGGGDIPPSMSYSLRKSSSGIDSVQITAYAYLYAGSPSPSHQIATCSFLVQDSAGLNSYELWVVRESPSPPMRIQIQRDQYTTVWPGEGYLMLSVSVGGPPVDSMKVHAVVIFVIAVREEPAELPDQAKLKLMQNYPNPFNPTTNINFELPSASNVTLAVFDILGREVSVLVNERRDAGVHEVKFDGSNLASGLYFYRLQAGNTSTSSGPRAESKGFVQTKRLVLLR